MTREEAYNRIDAIIAKHEIDDEYVTITNSKDYEALRTARKFLEQEPFINKPCVSSGVCEHDKQRMLDKIKAEIEFIPTIEWKDDGTTYILASYFKKQVLEIIDKYKAESEEQR